MKEKGISLTAFSDIEEIRKAIQLFPECRFELSYNLTEEMLREVLPIVEGRIASIHSLCPRREYFPNFATEDQATLSWSRDELLEDAELASQLGASFMVLHPGYLIDSLVPSDSESRISMMEREFSRYVLPGTKSIARRDYIHTPEYRKAFNTMKGNIDRISQEVKEYGVTLAIENLNPRSGYMLIHPDEIVELSRMDGIHFTIDIGHLWITTELYGIDFLSSLGRILATGKVVTTHFHSNITDGRKMTYEDSHHSIDRNNLPWKEAIHMIEETDANLIIEAKEEPIHNLEILFDYC